MRWRYLLVIPLCTGIFWGALQRMSAREPGLLASLEGHYNRVRTLEARFVQRHTLSDVTRVESGRVYFLKPGRMRWEYESPEEKLFLSDGTYVYLYVPAEHHVSRSRLSDTADWRVPFALLLGRIDFSELFSRVEIHRIERPARAPLTQVRALPKSQRQGFTEIWLDVNEARRLERIEIRQAGGVLMEFHFREWREGHVLAPDLFRLRVPPGTAWVDAPLAP